MSDPLDKYDPNKIPLFLILFANSRARAGAEPCGRCGERTAITWRWGPDTHAGETFADGPLLLCEECDPRSRLRLA